ncbi:chaplin family protein [Streptomyces sp. NEAU-W12]|uniref:chaplin family protein n=1 Tax=Streptomyces sp. NEAU-W12 TaxID=2994668 RepID=UPI00224A8698|nr:chaplin family protein [Streptomyces sp. NEAU-W12]MCX2927602.1 chaplin family protein [Streptomyces sp. NEAU-W12]
MSRLTKVGAAALGTGTAALGGTGTAAADAGADAASSPGGVSGDVVQVPVHVPVHACGRTVNVIGALNPASGTTCGNGGRAG